jgi:hypothetical protein
MYSIGVVLLQMAFPGLRSDNQIIAFNKKLRVGGPSRPLAAPALGPPAAAAPADRGCSMMPLQRAARLAAAAAVARASGAHAPPGQRPAPRTSSAAACRGPRACLGAGAHQQPACRLCPPPALTAPAPPPPPPGPQELDYDLGAWRRAEVKAAGAKGPKADLAEGFAVLDLEGGAGA